jgi:hypothetical protein
MNSIMSSIDSNTNMLKATCRSGNWNTR